ncbi:MAG: zinc ribbon domain-containing protein [Humidesulfovibrio sp.]|uniref:FmdB family zinc ribbon protein n=1 Tax=Humidesulfovibrio sp. TaxID=2910988 RepID=UPI0027EFDA75|nr:zinc ribbon domain-containing protein [Humidesulfovibrio sp.]MDQ7834767.1 zinc ribbon domain-containing protein [Humidesulfovibrio sp.]
MPIYEYSCQDCKQIFEDWQKDYEERDIPCPVCNGQASRLISSTNFVLKGGGWYASGYTDRPAPPETASAAAGGAPAPKAACACPGKAEPAEKAPPAPATVAS